ncbi:MAG: DUF499 domain-containing protein [Gemmatales bacterium]|nr:DUF499 domain-containing protein [Gemmatales bacterium]MDW8224293.1 DUF499 domain-containing protein [Gemmatales bacterium]
MKPWIQVVTPHADIRMGRLDESVYAADLSDVVADRGPLEYRDATMFFRKTYLTQGLIKLLSSVLGRLSGQNSGEAVIQIQTPFGGGKTHSLIALYHFIRHGREQAAALQDILGKIGLERVPDARIVTFVGTAADPLKGKTPWGELAWQLGRYELLQEHDQRRRAPGKDLLHQLLSVQPTLILMDETAEYAVKARDFRDQLVAFYQELTETVKVLPRCVLVATLPSSTPYGEEGERALHELQRVFGRVENIQTPVEGEEIYEVIRRRLFETVSEPQEARRTAEKFVEMYQELGDDLPKEVREPAYRNRMCQAYPFHPELIEVLFERWSTFPTFQRTRGVLRLLALVVSELYRTQHQAPLILPSHLSLAHPSIQAEFLRHVGNEYQGVIASDIADGGHAKSERIDQEMGSEYVRYSVASGLARAIFFASFSGSKRRGVGIQRLRLAMLQPGLPSAIISDALRRLEEELWYLHVEGGLYWFSSQPNLNRVIVEKEEAIKPEEITEAIRESLERLGGNELRCILWPRVSQDVPDNKELKLVLLGPEHTRPSGATDTFVHELLDRCGQTFRTFRNTVFVLAADEREFAEARQRVKRYLAYRAIRNDQTLWQQLTQENQHSLENKLKDAEAAIVHPLISAYRHLAKASEQGIEWLDLGLPTIGAKTSLSQRVREHLQHMDLWLDKISPQHLLDRAMGTESEKSVDDIYDTFLRYPNLPVLQSKQVLYDAIVMGVQQGIFAVRIGERTIFKQTISVDQLDSQTRVVRGTTVIDSSEQQSRRDDGTTITPPTGGTAPSDGTPPPPPTNIHEYKLEADIPWDKLSEFVRGVVMPLRNRGAEIKLRIRLEAQIQNGISQTVLDHSIRETLQQIGARIVTETPARSPQRSNG